MGHKLLGYWLIDYGLQGSSTTWGWAFITTFLKFLEIFENELKSNLIKTVKIVILMYLWAKIILAAAYTILLTLTNCDISEKRSSRGKAIPLHVWRGPEVSRRLRFPDFKTIGTWRWQECQPRAPFVFTPRTYSWYSFLLEAKSTPGP
jgi:hypothetical protein